jgi:hypothetical protein
MADSVAAVRPGSRRQGDGWGGLPWGSGLSELVTVIPPPAFATSTETQPSRIR